MSTPTKNTPKAPDAELTKEQLLAKLQAYQKSDSEQKAMINDLHHEISEKEIEQERKHLIATASDGKKYELRFISAIFPHSKTGISAQEVKQNPELLQVLIDKNSTLIHPLTLDNQEKGGQK